MSNIIRKTSDSSKLSSRVLEHQNLPIRKKNRVVPTRRLSIEEQKIRLTEFQFRLEDSYFKLKNQMDEEYERVHTSLNAMQQQKEVEWEELTARKSREAEDLGFKSGYDAGIQQAQLEMSEKKLAIQCIVEEAYLKKDSIIKSAEPLLLSLSTAIAQKVLKKELETAPNAVQEMVSFTLKKVQDRGEIILHVSPEDYINLAPLVEELEKQLDVNASLKISPIHDLVIGSALLHTPSGSYDISINSQLSEIKKQLMELFEETNMDEH